MARRVGPIRRLVLQEYGAAKEGTLTNTEVADLELANRHWRARLGLPSDPLLITQSQDQTLIKARHVTGVIRAGSLELEIAPKFLTTQDEPGDDWRAALWRILAITQPELSVLESISASESSQLSFPDMLADAFLGSISVGVLRGFPLAYREQRLLSATVRGSFDSHRIADWLTRPWRIPSRYTELSDDTLVSRLLRWASEQLELLVISPQRAKALGNVSRSLSHVGSYPPTMAQARGLRLTTQHQALEKALSIAVMLRTGRGLDMASGEDQLSGFLWKSDDVYEDFLFWLCQRVAHSRGMVVSKRPFTFGISNHPGVAHLTTIPDVVFYDGPHQPRAILDAKYKRYRGKPNPADSYQVLTAAHTLGCPHVGLTYPSQGPTPSRRWEIQSRFSTEQISLWALWLDLLLAGSEKGIGLLEQHISQWLDAVSTDGATTPHE